MMARLTIGYAALLIALGAGGYIGSGGASVTALIPALFGVVFLVLGGLALRESLRKHAMHAAAALALLGFLATVGGWLKLPALISGGEVDRPLAVVSKSVMAALSAIFLGLCVRSFIEARRNRAKGE